MRVWLLHIGEELPVDGTTRLFRYGYLARAFTERGHEVLRWAPTFRHATKTFRFSADSRVPVWKGYDIQFVHSPGYRRNVGFERLRAYRVLDRRFREMSAREPKPDLIVAAIPSLEWAAAATEFGARHGIPVVVDVRDLWPDVFLNAFPKPIRPLGRILLGHYERLARRSCARATSLAAVSPSYLRWAVAKAGRHQRPTDQVLPIGFEPDRVPANIAEKQLAALCARGVDPARPICVFSGLFERSYDLATVIEAARLLQTDSRSAPQFIFCGDGSQMPALRRQAADLSNIHFLDWVDAPTLQATLSISTIGLCAYADDALQSWPNKPFEYMANSLGVVSSLSGDLAELLHRHQCGRTYRAGDPRSLAGCLHALLADPTKLAAMRSKAHQTWAQNFHSSQIYDRFVARLETIAQSAAHAA